MLPNSLKPLANKLKQIPQIYKTKISPTAEHFLNILLIQPGKSLLRYNMLSKAYNPRYSMFSTFCKTFLIIYFLASVYNYNIALSSQIGKNIQLTEYMHLLKKASEDSAGADRVEYAVKQMVEKGKKHGLLSIELNQIAYLLEPYEIGWQGKYLASLKA